MPSGRTHDRLTWVSVPVVTVSVWWWTAQTPTALAVGCAYLFSGLMFSGDLDIHSVQYKRWGPLRWLWRPYRKLVTHRSFLSHGPVIGTFGRVVYLGMIVALLTTVGVLAGNQWLGGQIELLAEARKLAHDLEVNLSTIGWVLLGLELGAISHSASDWIGSGLSRLKRIPRRHARRGHR